MSKIFGLLVLLVSIAAVFGRDRFPTCEELLADFERREINLYTDGEGVRNIKSTECIMEDAR